MKARGVLTRLQKAIFAILFIVIFASQAKAQNGGTVIPKAEANAAYEATIIVPLSINQEEDLIKLGTIRPGEEVSFVPGSKSIHFRVEGQQNKQYSLHARIYTNSQNLDIDDYTWQYWDKDGWNDIDPYSTHANHNDGTFFDFVGDLGDDGMSRLRIYPQKMKANPGVEKDETVEYQIEVRCEYYGL